jgi:hypothetical protein
MMLVLGVAVVFMALLVAEYGGRVVVGRVAQNQLQSQGIADAQVTVGGSWWRPTLLPAVLGGGLDRVSVQLRDAEVSGVLVERADYVLEDLDVDPDPFGASLGVTSVGEGSFRLTVSPASVGRLLGVNARVVDGRLVVGPDGEPAKLRLDGTELVVESPYLARQRLPHRFTVLDGRLLPCDPEVRLDGELVELRCSGDRLPRILDASMGEPVGRLPAPPTELEPSATIERRSTSSTAPSTTTTTAPSPPAAAPAGAVAVPPPGPPGG